MTSSKDPTSAFKIFHPHPFSTVSMYIAITCQQQLVQLIPPPPPPQLLPMLWIMNHHHQLRRHYFTMKNYETVHVHDNTNIYEIVKPTNKFEMRRIFNCVLWKQKKSYVVCTNIHSSFTQSKYQKSMNNQDTILKEKS